MLQKLIEEIERLQLAENILREVYLNRNYPPLEPSTISRMEQYFTYDDSE